MAFESVKRRVWVVLACAALLLPAAACRSASPATAPPAEEAVVAEAVVAEAVVTEQAATEPVAYENTIRWATATELENFGFDVYRGESEDGPFTRLTEQAIQGAGTTDVPQRYRYVDDAIDPCRAYYYYVESISMAGVRERFTPVARVAPKSEQPCDP
ncbi:MAG TPA: hypothetical protein VKU40_01280 [Thermoanaerobaculia bacterium]|nr:hypothetical protein [Thermoanaerobaculia bacterium]